MNKVLNLFGISTLIKVLPLMSLKWCSIWVWSTFDYTLECFPTFHRILYMKHDGLYFTIYSIPMNSFIEQRFIHSSPISHCRSKQFEYVPGMSHMEKFNSIKIQYRYPRSAPHCASIHAKLWIIYHRIQPNLPIVCEWTRNSKIFFLVFEFPKVSKKFAWNVMNKQLV